MKETFYFSHDSNARNDEKILAVRMRFGVEGYGIYFMLIERMREESDYMSIKDYNSLAFDFRVSADKVKSIVEDFGLFSFTEDGKRFYSESFMKRMTIKDGKKQRRSNAARMKWESVKGGSLNASDLRSQRLSEARKKGTHTKEEWAEMLEFFGQCLICGEKENLVKDHIQPIYQGGDDSIKNLQPLCRSCNSRKGPDSTDHRLIFCAEHGVEMPEKWKKTPAKRLQCSSETPPNKRKESKVNIKKPLSNERVKESEPAERDSHTLLSAEEKAISEKSDLQQAEEKIPPSPSCAPPLPPDGARKTRARFIPPSVEEVRLYIAEKGYEVDAEAFVAFYTSKDWYVGRNKMKNWRAALVTWHKRPRLPDSGRFTQNYNYQNNTSYGAHISSDPEGDARKAYIARKAAAAVAECNSRGC